MSLRILITRPAGQSVHTVTAITALGHQVASLPCLEIIPVPMTSELGQTNKVRAMNLDVYAHVVIISTNAAANFLPLVEAYWPQWPIQQTWWGMGQSTENALKQAGLAKVRKPNLGDTSEALLDELLPLVNTHDKVLIVRGVGGRETLAEALQAKGALVDYVQCYQRQAPVVTKEDKALLSEFRPQIIVLQSGETLVNYHCLYAQHLHQLGINPVLLLPSQRVMDIALSLGFENCLFSKGASDAAICDTLRKLA